jgi:hypothetical protein
LNYKIGVRTGDYGPPHWNQEVLVRALYNWYYEEEEVFEEKESYYSG